jgi:hypothetical protein
MKNRFFKLPFLFDEVRLMHDLSLCLEFHWKNHFNQQDYHGRWTSISLRSASGSETDIYSHPGITTYTDTPALEKCLYFQDIIRSFQCTKETIRLLSLAPQSTIREHTDIQMGYEYGVFRIHIPVQTDTDVSFIVDGSDIPMKKGECWYANFHLPHSVENKGTAERIHLVMDCQRNEWSDILFREAGYDFEYERQRKDYDRETKKKMIEELSRMNTAASEQLIEKLKKELSANE